MRINTALPDSVASANTVNAFKNFKNDEVNLHTLESCLQNALIRKINFKAQNRKTKSDTNPIPDPNRYRRRCPDPNARIQKWKNQEVQFNWKADIDIGSRSQVNDILV